VDDQDLDKIWIGFLQKEIVLDRTKNRKLKVEKSPSLS